MLLLALDFDNACTQVWFEVEVLGSEPIVPALLGIVGSVDAILKTRTDIPEFDGKLEIVSVIP